MQHSLLHSGVTVEMEGIFGGHFKFQPFALEGESVMQKYKCAGCDFIYDPAVGDPDGGIAPGTAFEAIPDSWVCPICGLTKEDFEAAE